MSDSEDDSILDNISNTRQLWNAKAKAGPIDYLVPKSPVSPIKPLALVPVENGLNGHTHVEIIRAEDENKDDFSSMPLPDVKSIKSQWEKPGPAAVPRKSHHTYERRSTQTIVENELPVPEPVNRNQEETKEEYEVHLGALKEKFELEAKASAGTYPSLIEGRRSPRSSAAVIERKNLKKKHVTANARSSGSNRSSKKRFEAEIQSQRDYNANSKETTVDVPTVELSSIKQQFESRKDERAITPFNQTKKKPRQISVCSDVSSQSAEIVRYEDHEELINYEIELSSLRKKFEQKSPQENRSKQFRASHNVTTVQKKKVTHEQNVQSRTLSSESDTISNIEVVKSTDNQCDEMIGEESVKDRLARFKAMAQENEKKKVSKATFTFKKQSIVVSKKQEESHPSQESVEEYIVRSPPAGTKESPDYVPSLDLQETKLLFEQSPSGNRRSSQQSSRSSSESPKRVSRSRSSPPNSRSSASNSQSPSPNRLRRSESGSRSSRSSSRGSPTPGSKTKKTGDLDVVVLEHTEVSYYYQEGSKRHSTKIKGLEETEEADMSNFEVIRPEPAGTKEEPDYVPSVNISSVRNMFEKPQDDDKPSRGRGPPPKKAVILEKMENRCESALSESPDRDPDVVRSARAGYREEPVYELSVDLKSARSKFESPQRPNDYVPRNTIQRKDDEVRQRRAADAVASSRSSESSDSSFEVVKTAEAGVKEKPEYTLSVDLKSTKQMFEQSGTAAPMPKRESSSTRVIQHQEVKGEVVRPVPAGTREVVVIQTTSDIKNVKKRFEHSDEQQEEAGDRKEPIDIQKEARDVIRKDREVKQESKIDENGKGTSSESDSQQTDTEGEVALDQDSSEVESQDYSEEVNNVDSKTPTENDEEEPTAAGVVPVRVAITEDLQETTYEEEDPQPEANVGYNTYNKVIDYQEEVQPQPQSTSDSDSESGEESSDKKQSSPSPDSLVEVQSKDQVQDEPEQQAYQEENHVSESPEDSFNLEEQREYIEDEILHDAGSPSDIKHQEGTTSPVADGDNYLQ